MSLNCIYLLKAGIKNRTKAILHDHTALIDFVNVGGQTLLHLAAHFGHLSIVELLLEKKPSIANISDNDKATALHIALSTHNVRTAIMLIEKAREICLLQDTRRIYCVTSCSIFWIC